MNQYCTFQVSAHDYPIFLENQRQLRKSVLFFWSNIIILRARLLFIAHQAIPLAGKTCNSKYGKVAWGMLRQPG
jgi:hypothetical protein